MEHRKWSVFYKNLNSNYKWQFSWQFVCYCCSKCNFMCSLFTKHYRIQVFSLFLYIVMSWPISIINSDNSNRSIYSLYLVGIQYKNKDLCEIYLFWIICNSNQLTWTEIISLTIWTHGQYSLTNFNLDPKNRIQFPLYGIALDLNFQIWSIMSSRH